MENVLNHTGMVCQSFPLHEQLLFLCHVIWDDEILNWWFQISGLHLDSSLGWNSRLRKEASAEGDGLGCPVSRMYISTDVEGVCVSVNH